MSGRTPFEEWWDARPINDRLMHLHHDRSAYTEEGWNAGVATERARLREKVEALRTIDLHPPLAKDGYLLAVKDVLALLSDPGNAKPK